MACIHCGKCTLQCDFLSKYGLDLEGFSHHPELAYHCFLCGTCATRCPKGLDGRAVALEMRRKQVQAVNGKFSRLPEAGRLRPLVWEKKRYLFRTYRLATPGPALFPGCNFPSFFPKTTRRLIALLRQQAGMGVIMDCCGKPIYELGMARESRRIRAGLTERLRRRGVTTLVVLCPNCYCFLKGRLDIPVVSIYQTLRELNLIHPLSSEHFSLYLPCPDRAGRAFADSLLPLLPGEVEEIQDIQCCGLGGCASAQEPQLARNFGEKLRAKKLSQIVTYCASCAGGFSRSGCGQVTHLLPALLGVDEIPPTGGISLINRAKFKLL